MQAAVLSSERLSGPWPASHFLEDSRQSRNQKKVRFDATAVDNEYKMRPRQKRPSPIGTAAFSRDFEILPSSWSSAADSGPSVSRKTYSPAPWPLSTEFRSQEARKLDLAANPRYPAQASWTLYPLTQNRARTPLPGLEPRIPTMTSTSGSRTFAKGSANSAVKRDKASHVRNASHVPPRVPDAPSWPNQRPPPAPRPSRLPTPDLMDVDGEMFCPCDLIVSGKDFISVGKKPIAKMDAQCMVIPL